MTKVTLHGNLGEKVGKKIWNLSILSVSEAIRAIESQSKKLFKTFIQNDKKDIKYRVLINGKDFLYDRTKNINTPEGVFSSEIVMDVENLETIDFIPVFEGAGGGSEGSSDAKSMIAIIVGVILIVASGGSGAMLMAGIGLVAAGVTNLLTPKPKFEDFQEIQSGGGKKNFTFSGPQNTIREGGPVFVGYGRLVVGSQVIHSSLKTYDVKNGNKIDQSKYTKYGYWGNEYYGLDYKDGMSDSEGNNFSASRRSSEEINKMNTSPFILEGENQVGEVSNNPGGEQSEYIFNLEDGSFFFCEDEE